MQAAISQTRQQLAAKAKDAPRSYAVVPYHGPNETHRRPIYIECREDSVILQPEGIQFGAGDFEGPRGPGNPLAAAVRAVREAWQRQGVDFARSGEPYPLLLVRPQGIKAYLPPANR